MKTLLLVFAVLSIICDAVSDAHLDRYKKRNHIMKSLSIFFVLLSGCMNLFIYSELFDYVSILLRIGQFVSVYTLLRLGLFNFVYNTAKGNSPTYIGNTDPILDKWFRKLPSWLAVSLYVISLFAAGVLLTL